MPTVEPAQPGDGQEQLDQGRDEDRARVDVERRVLTVDARHAEPEPGDDREVPEHGRQRGHGEVVVGVEDPDDDAAEPEQHHDREQHPREPDGEIEVAARISERLDQQRRDQDEDRREPAEDEEHEPEDRRRDPPGALAVALLDQVAEDRDERARERGIGEQGANEVRDLERDRERVDLAVDAEVVGRDHLAHEAEDPGEAGRDREDQGRAGEPAVLAAARGRLGGIGSVAHAGRVRRRHALHLRMNGGPRVAVRGGLEALLRSLPPASCGHSYARG